MIAPAPWEVRPCPEHPSWCRVYSADKKFVALVETVELAERMVLWRNAEDVMVRRRWGVVHRPSGWFPAIPEVARLEPLRTMRWADPHLALVEADEWYKKNIDTNSTGE